MKIYHKIQTVFKRDPENNYKTLLEGEFSRPEFKYLSNNVWVFTEKVNGTNIRVMWDGTNVKFSGKTDNAQLHADLVQHLRDTFTDDVMTKILGVEGDICLYGEGCGAGIQKGGGRYYQDKRFVLFDVKVGEWWLQSADVIDIATKFNIPMTPIIGEGTLQEMVELVRNGITSTWGSFAAEGIVARPKCELFARNGQRIITKLKTEDFTHKEEDDEEN